MTSLSDVLAYLEHADAEDLSKIKHLQIPRILRQRKPVKSTSTHTEEPQTPAADSTKRRSSDAYPVFSNRDCRHEKEGTR